MVGGGIERGDEMTFPLCGAPMTKEFNGFGPFWICVLWDVRGWGCMGYRKADDEKRDQGLIGETT